MSDARGGTGRDNRAVVDFVSPLRAESSLGVEAAKAPLPGAVRQGDWVRVFADEKLTTALLDRRGHHAHILHRQGAVVSHLGPLHLWLRRTGWLAITPLVHPTGACGWCCGRLVRGRGITGSCGRDEKSASS